MADLAHEHFVELLTEDFASDEPATVEGMKIPVDRDRVIVYEGDTKGERRHAYLHTFFRRDELGQSVDGTLVKFFVPEHLCCDGRPSRAALELVAHRMGWGR